MRALDFGLSLFDLLKRTLLAVLDSGERHCLNQQLAQNSSRLMLVQWLVHLLPIVLKSAKNILYRKTILASVCTAVTELT